MCVFYHEEEPRHRHVLRNLQHDASGLQRVHPPWDLNIKTNTSVNVTIMFIVMMGDSCSWQLNDEIKDLWV